MRGVHLKNITHHSSIKAPWVGGQKAKRKQRGAIAVEFALVVPLFLTMLGLVMNTGLSYFARFQLTNAASAAARYCVSQVNVSQNSVSGCVSNYMNAIDLQVVSGLCHNITVTPAVLPGPGGNASMKLLQVNVSCDAIWVTAANAVTRETRDFWTINMSSAMPFTAIN